MGERRIFSVDQSLSGTDCPDVDIHTNQRNQPMNRILKSKVSFWIMGGEACACACPAA